MASETIRKQDLPPDGGYKKIHYARVPMKTYFTGVTMIASYIGISYIGFYIYYRTCKQIKREEIEMRSAQNVIYPILFAERDREFLKQLRRNRDEEAKLMANVKGWEVGTWFGEPIFRTLPKDTLVAPTFKEFYVHADYKSMAKRAHLALWN